MTRIRRHVVVILTASAIGAGLFLVHHFNAPPSKEAAPTSAAELAEPTATQPDQPVPLGLGHDHLRPDPTTVAEPAHPTLTSPLDALLERATLVSEATESIGPNQTRRFQIWKTDGTYPFVRTEETGTSSKKGGETVHHRLAMVADHILIQLTTVDPSSQTLDALEAAGVALFHPVTDDGLFRARLDRFEDPVRISHALAQLRPGDHGIVYSEPDYLLEADRLIPNDPKFSTQAWLDRSRGATDPNRDVDAPEGWSVSTSAAEVVVAVVDSGIRLTHDDIAQNLWFNPLEAPGNDVDDDGNGVVDDVHGYDAITGQALSGDQGGHGTLVAGVIGARGNNGKGITGMAWSVRLMGVRFMDTDGTGATSDAIKAIDYAVANGADVINNSWGGSGKSAALETALRRAGQKGVILITSAGNEGNSLSVVPNYPGAYELPTQLVVAAVNDSDEIANFSNYSPSLVHLAAPESALSTNSDSNTSYSRFSGTSASAPYVSGTAALLKAHLPGSTAHSIIARILSTVEPRPSLTSFVASGGRLNLHRTLANIVDAPDNDAFADAAPISTDGQLFHGLLVRSTSEANESTPPGFSGRTVWYRFTASRTGSGRISLRPSGFTGGFCLYTGGDLETLSRVTTVRSATPGTPAEIDFTFIAGQSYRIQVDTTDQVSGLFTLSVALAPANDSFASPSLIEGEEFEVSGSNRLASEEPGEPVHHLLAAGRSVWYHWTAPASGTLNLSTEGASGQIYPAVYQGNLPSSLTAVDSAFDHGIATRLLVPVTAGIEYRIAIDSRDATGTPFTLRGWYIQGPRILGQPQDQVVNIGADAVFSVTITGGTESIFQWFFNGDAIPGETQGTLIIANAELIDAGTYHAAIVTGGTILRSRDAGLTVVDQPPEILLSPFSNVVETGETAVFEILTHPSQGVAFEWFHNGQRLEGVEGSTLRITQAGVNDSGFYRVVARTGSGAVESDPFYLHVSPLSPYSYFAWSANAGHPDSLSFISWVHDRYIVTGSRGTIGFSIDGETWQFSSAGQSEPVYGAVFGNEAWMAWGPYDRFRSTDLIEWEQMPVASGADQIAFGNGRFVEASARGLGTSVDGKDWDGVGGLPDIWFYGVAYGNGRFLASHYGGFYRSDDGLTWTEHTVSGPTSRGKVHFSPVSGWWTTYSGGQVMNSPDGSTWKNVSPAFSFSRKIKVDSTDGAVYLLDSNTGIYRWSGSTWENTIASEQWAVDFAVRDGRFIAVRKSQIAPISAAPPPYNDDRWWTGANFTAANGLFFGFQDDAIYQSGDGVHWFSSPNPGLDPHGASGLSYGNGIYVTKNARGPTPDTLAQSSFYWNQVEFGNGHFVAVTGSRSHRSVDGLDWQESAILLPEYVDCLAFENGRFLAGGRGMIAHSLDGLSWTVSLNDNFEGVDYFAYGNDRYLAAATDGTISSSVDGTNWSYRSKVRVPNHGSRISGMVFHRDRFLVICSGMILESSNGLSWQVTTSGLAAYEPVSLLKTGDTILVKNYRGPPARLGPGASTRSHLEIIEPSSDRTVRLNTSVPIQVLASSPSDPFTRFKVDVNGIPLAELLPPVTATQYTPDAAGEFTVTVVGETQSGESGQATRRIVAGVGTFARPLPAGFNMTDITVFEGAFYGAGAGGLVYVSLDGRRWNTRQTPTRAKLIAFQVAPAGICAIDDKGGVIFSDDGIQWIHTPDLGAGWPVEPHRTDFFAMLGGYQYGWLSYDGQNWFSGREGIPRSKTHTPNKGPAQIFGTTPYRGRPGDIAVIAQPPSDGGVIGIVPWKGQLVALTPVHVFLTPDGLEWNDITPPGYPTDRFTRASNAGGVLVIHEDADHPDAVGAIHLSGDGDTWQSTLLDQHEPLETVFRNGNFFSVTHNAILRSSDGHIWEKVLDLESAHFQTTRIVAGPNGVLALRTRDSDGDHTILASTTDGDNWHIQTARTTAVPDNIVGAASRLHAVVDYPPAILEEQPDRSWVEVPETGLNETAVFGNGRFVQLTYRDDILVSEDLVNWTQVLLPTLTADDRDFRLEFDQVSTFWLVGNNSIVGKSENGINWTDVRSGNTSDVHRIRGFKNMHFAISQDVLRSEDAGKTWTRIDDNIVPVSSRMIAATRDRILTFSRDLDFSGGGAQHMNVSVDGRNWENVVVPDSYVRSIQANDTNFYLSGEWLWSSPNGHDWTRLAPRSSGGVIRPFGDRLLAFGSGYVREFTHRDLAMERISLSGEQALAGAPVPVTLDVRNAGRSTIAPRDIEIDLLLTTKAQTWGVPEDGRYHLQSIAGSLPSMSPGETYPVEAILDIPATIRPAIYEVAACLVPSSRYADGNSENDVTFASASSRVEILRRNLDITIVGEGQVHSSLPIHDLADGQTVVLVPKPYQGHEFEAWSGDVPAGHDILDLYMDRDRHVTAAFAPRQYTLTVNRIGNGTITGLPLSGTVHFGEEIHLHAQPSPDWDFLNWSGDLKSDNTDLSFSVTRDHAVQARFGQDYSQWASTQLAELTDEQRGPAVDADGDGYTNEAEFALATDPTDPDDLARMEFKREGVDLVVELPVSRTALGIRATLEFSTDLNTWTAAPQSPTVTAFDVDRARLQYRFARNSVQPLFLRIVVDESTQPY